MYIISNFTNFLVLTHSYCHGLLPTSDLKVETNDNLSVFLVMVTNKENGKNYF